MSKILRGLRGATTAAANTREAILEATAELLRALQEANGFQPDEVESAIFTSSPDLTAEYPARAAGRGVTPGSIGPTCTTSRGMHQASSRSPTAVAGTSARRCILPSRRSGCGC